MEKENKENIFLVSDNLALHDLWNKSSKKHLCCCLIVLLIVYVLYLYLDFQNTFDCVKEVIPIILQVVSTITGLTLAAFAFILSSKLPDKLDRINKKTGNTFFDTLCADITIAIIIQICTIFLALILDAFCFFNVILSGLLLVLTIMSLYFTYIVVLNMYTTRNLLLRRNEGDSRNQKFDNNCPDVNVYDSSIISSNTISNTGETIEENKSVEENLNKDS